MKIQYLRACPNVRLKTAILLFTIFSTNTGLAQSQQAIQASSDLQKYVVSAQEIYQRERILQSMEKLKYSGAYQEALKIADDLHAADLAHHDSGDKTPSALIFQSSFLAAILHAVTGDFPQAITLYNDALAEIKKGLPVDSPTKYRIATGLLLAYRNTGQTANAVHFLESISRQDDTGLNIDSAWADAMLCRVYVQDNQPEPAIASCRLAQKARQNTLAAQSAEAIRLGSRMVTLQQSAMELQNVLSPEDENIAAKVDSVADTGYAKTDQSFQYSLGPYAQMAQLYAKGGQQKELATLYRNDFKSYAALIENALGDSNSGNAVLEDEYANIAVSLARLRLQTEATDAFRHALDLNSKRLAFMARMFNPMLLANSLSTRRVKEGAYASYVLARDGLDQALLQDLAGQFLQAKGVQTELLAQRYRAVLNSKNPMLIQRYKAATSGGKTGYEAALRSAMLMLGNRQLNGMQDVYDNGAVFYNKVTQRLKEQTLVSIHRYMPYDFSTRTFNDPHYLALRVKSGEVIVRDLGFADPIDLEIQRYRANIGNSLHTKTPFDFKEQGHHLYDMLLAPVLGDRLVAGNYVADMDGMTNLLPLEALVDGSGKFLLETGDWRYVSSARALLREPVPSSSNAALVFANPDYDWSPSPADNAGSGFHENAMRIAQSPLPESLKFQPLPDTAKEAEAIRKPLVSLGAKVTILQGAAANTDTLGAVDAPRFLHIASHGFYSDTQASASTVETDKKSKLVNDLALDGGLDAGIALAGANTAESNDSAKGKGIFFQNQFRLLNLKGTELVVLSACDTGVGSLRIGEGVTSLRQSLELAGAQSTITSLWEVPSAETASIMRQFYELLAKGKTKTEALNTAKRNSLRRNQNPAFWAGFVYAGLE
jgi:CHAT domain-containing protein